jgi:hypothetical protein
MQPNSWACATQDGGKKHIQIGFCCNNVKERDLLEDIGVNERTMLKWILKK